MILLGVVDLVGWLRLVNNVVYLIVWVGFAVGFGYGCLLLRWCCCFVGYLISCAVIPVVCL